MLGYVGVFVVENTFDNAAKEAEIQCGERKEITSVDKPVLTQVIDIARELKDACLPDFLLNASTGEVKTKQVETTSSISVHTAGWSKGVYVIKVTVGKDVITKKIVLK